VIRFCRDAHSRSGTGARSGSSGKSLPPGTSGLAYPRKRRRLHDLRRTARSLMSRAGVAADIAEITIGHALPGIRGVYDRHRYLAEKRAALEKLPALLDRIIAPAVGNIVPLALAAAQ
jgi:integrase